MRVFRFRVVSAALLCGVSVMLASPSPAFARPKKAAPAPAAVKKYEGVDNPVVIQALRAFDDLDYVGAVELLEKAQQSAALTKVERQIVFRTQALTHIALGEAEQARRDFEGLLRLSPDFELDKTFSSNVRAVFDEAKASLAIVGNSSSQLPNLNSRRSTDNAKEGEPVTVNVLAPAGTQRIELLHRTRGETPFSSITGRPADDGKVELVVPGMDVKHPALEYYLKAFGGNDQMTATDGSISAPLSLTVYPLVTKSRTRPWVWGVVAGVIVVVGGVAAGVAVAETRPSDTAHVSLIPH